MMERHCKNCTAFKWIEGKTGECRRNPPTPFMVGMPTGPQILGTKQTRVQFQFPAAWPPVMEDQWCVTGYEAKVYNGKEPEAEPSGC